MNDIAAVLHAGERENVTEPERESIPIGRTNYSAGSFAAYLRGQSRKRILRRIFIRPVSHYRK